MAQRHDKTEAKDGTDAVTDFASEELLGARHWKRSKVGYLTGASTVTDAMGSMVKHGRGSVDRVKALGMMALATDRSGRAIDPEIEDSRERFVEAMAMNGRSLRDIDRSVGNTFAQFWLYAALAAISIVFGCASFLIYPFSMTGFTLVNCMLAVARFSPLMVLLPLILRSGWTNWSFRRRRLLGLGDYLRSGAILPKRPPAPSSKPPRAANDGLPARRTVSILACLVIAAAAIALVAGVHPAFAQDANTAGTAPGSIFVDNTNSNDLFMRLLAYVIPNTGPIGTPAEGITPMHEATKAGFLAFSGTLLFIGMTIAGWHILSGLVASAKEGTALGRNYHEVWAPARVVVGFGMLTPVAGGMCGAQLLVLYLIVWGGNLANVVYQPYMQKLTLASVDSSGSVARNTAVIGNMSVATEVVQGIMRHEVCWSAVQQWMSRNPGSTDSSIVQNPTWVDKAVYDYQQGSTTLSEYGNVPLTQIGTSRVMDYGPACGRLEVSKGYTSPQTTEQRLTTQIGGVRTSQIEAIQGTLRGLAKSLTQTYVDYTSTNTPGAFSVAGNDFNAAQTLKSARDGYITAISSAVQQAYTSTNADIGGQGGELQTVRDEAMRNGWAAAGTFYLTTARLQQAIYTSATEGMKMTSAPNAGVQSVSSGINNLLQGVDGKVGVMPAWDAWWQRNLSNVVPDISEQATRAQEDVTDFGSAMTKVFGGLAKAWMVTSSSQQALNPMQSMIDYGNRLIGAGVGAYVVASGIAATGDNMLLKAAGDTASVATFGWATAGSAVLKGLSQIGSLTMMLSLAIIAAGVIHAVIIPLVPYIMTVFFVASMLVLTVEALVAAPIWAFVHIRMDGQDFVDQVQRPGYMIAFNLVLRPALMIFGLILSYLVFGAMTWFVAVTFKAAAMSLAGSTGIGLLAAIVLIVLLSYLDFQLASRSFHLITQVPDRVTRWFGQGGENLGEEHESGKITAFLAGQIGNRMESMSRGASMKSMGQSSGGGGGGAKKKLTDNVTDKQNSEGDKEQSEEKEQASIPSKSNNSQV